MVHLTLDAFEGSICATAYADRGIPLLQPYAVAFSLEDELRQQIIQMQGSSLMLESAAEAVAVAVLAELMGAELVVSCQRSVQGTPPVDLLAEFQQLVDEAGSNRRGQVMNVSDSGPIKLKLNQSTVNAGVQLGVFHKEKSVGSIRSRLDIRFDLGISGFRAAESMQIDRDEHGISLPDGFDALSVADARRALRAVRCPSAAAVYAYADAERQEHAKRLQAAEAYPLLAEFFVHSPELLAAIDQGGQLRPLVATHTKLSAGQLKRLGKLETPLPAGRLFEFGDAVRGENQLGINRTRTHSVSGELRLGAALELLRPLHTNWIPNTERNWKSLTDIAAACALPLHSAFDVPVHQLFATSKGNWHAYRSSLAAAAQIPEKDFDRHQLALCTIDAMDAVDDFSHSVVLPQVLGVISNSGERTPYPSQRDLETARQVSFLLLTCGSKNIVGTLFSTSRRWIARIPTLIEAEERAADGHSAAIAKAPVAADRWPALAEDFTASNGLVVRNLVTVRDLKDESARLKHCVGRLYIRKTRQGRCHIFSVRDPVRPQSHSTIELSPPATLVEQLARAQFEIIQHKGASNRKPEEKAQVACKEWFHAIRSGQLELHLEDAIDWSVAAKNQDSWSESARTHVSSDIAWDDILGTHWRNPVVQSAIWTEWRENILGKSFARETMQEAIFALPEARDFLCTLNTAAGASLEA